MLYTEDMQKSKSIFGNGFTVVELLVVVVVIAILASITIIAYNGVQGRTRDDKRKTDILNITKALELYYSDNGAYPVSTATSSALGGTWYSSGDASWMPFSLILTGANAMSSVPLDPTPGVTIAPWTPSGYQYAYISNGMCGTIAQGQWYMLVWRYENSTQGKTAIGAGCTTNSYLTTASAGGASYYLFSRT